MKTALVAGGAGFIGSNLCERLVNDHYRVICLDNFLTGSRENVAHLLSSKRLGLVERDISQPGDFPIGRWRLDVVVNLASPASPKDYQRYPLETLRAGAAGTDNLLKLALEHKARFVHASTSEVYGDPQEHPQKESYWGRVNSYGPRSMYDEAKRYSEALVRSWRIKHNLSTGVVRIFNTYGPRMQPDDGRVVSNFIVQALKGKPLTIYGDGSQTRSFCYIDDMVEAIAAMIERNAQGPINLGNPTELSIKELARKVLELTGSNSRLNLGPRLKDDPGRRRPDISKAKRELGWRPRVELEKGLVKTIEYFQTKI